LLQEGLGFYWKYDNMIFTLSIQNIRPVKRLKRIINKLKSVKAKVLVENFFSLSILQVITFIFPLITTPYIAKTIGLASYGKIAFAAAFCAYFTIIVDYGFNLTATREVSRNKSSESALNYIYTKVFFSKLFLLSLSSIVFLAIVLSVRELRSNFYLYCFSYFVVINNLFYPQWFFQGIEKMKFITLFNILIQTLYVISIFIFIRIQSDYLLLPLLTGVFTFLIGLTSMIIINRRFKVKFVRISFSDVTIELKNSRYIFINQLMPNLYNNSSTFFLGIFAPASTVGLYAAAQKVISIGTSLLNILSRVFFPHLAHSPNNYKLYQKIILSTALVMAIGYCIFAEIIFKILFTPEFQAGIRLVYIMSLGLFFLGVYDCFGTNGLLLIGKEKILMKNTIVVSFLGSLLTIYLAYKYSEYGAAISVAITRSMMGIGTMVLFLRSKTQ
jgi:polysaccharide transporter, PST family